MKNLLGYIKAIPAFVGRVRNQPVLMATAAFIAFQAYQQAAASSLGTEDIFIAVAEAIIGWLASQLVVPTAKVDKAVLAVVKDQFLNAEEEKLYEPYLGEEAEDGS